MRLFILFAISCILVSCSAGKKKNPDYLLGTNLAKYIIPAEIGDLKTESAEYIIKSARIEGNKMILLINFSGGCTSYKADLIGSEFLMKSLPPKRNVKLILEKEGDCREYKEVEFIFSIEELAYQKEKGSEIILLLQNYDKPISYIFD